jgi:hypothetical protein
MTLISRKEVPVFEWAAPQILTIPMARDENPQDLLLDARRNTVYRLRRWADGPAHRIDGVNVVTGAPVEPIVFEEVPISFALSASGDSLILTFSEPEYALGIVDLLPAQRSLSVMPLQYDTGVRRVPAVGHAAGGRFFLALVHGLYAARILEVDFSGGGAHVIRNDIDGGSDISAHPVLLRLPDGRLVIGPDAYYGWPEHRLIYSPSTNAFAVTFRLQSAPKTRFSASPSGRFMMNSTVYGAGFDSVANVSTQDWALERGSPPAALSSDGQSVYLPTHYGYQKVRLSDGLMVEQVKLGMTILRLVATPDGSRLIAVGESVVKVVSLN